MDFPDKFFITGTDTGVGKTMISAILTKGLKAAYWKPVQSGLREETDTEWVCRNTGLADAHFIPEQFQLTEPLSPHLSARLDGIRIKLEDFQLPEISGKHLIIEGAGGIMVPLNDNCLMTDLIRYLNVPTILVARSGLGTINHTLLSLEKLRSLNIPVLGVVLNGPENPENKKAIEHYGNARVIAEISTISSVTPRALQEQFENNFII